MGAAVAGLSVRAGNAPGDRALDRWIGRAGSYGALTPPGRASKVAADVPAATRIILPQSGHASVKLTSEVVWPVPARKAQRATASGVDALLHSVSAVVPERVQAHNVGPFSMACGQMTMLRLE
jgi:hypothetical protein